MVDISIDENDRQPDNEDEVMDAVLNADRGVGGQSNYLGPRVLEIVIMDGVHDVMPMA